MLRDIPCAPLYELVDFAPDLPQEECDLLEAQLTDAGLLDALVVPEEHLPAIRELLEEYPDRFLIPGPAVEEPILSLIPDATGRFPKEAATCLRSISRSDPNSETALLPDGRFRCGMVRGRSHAEVPAGFVGTAAREEKSLTLSAGLPYERTAPGYEGPERRPGNIASCPQILALDEAFAGVDDQNISAMFELMGVLDFDYIINSQALWGCYACVADLDIAEMHHPPNAPVVTILRYHWNGKQRTLEDSL